MVEVGDSRSPNSDRIVALKWTFSHTRSLKEHPLRPPDPRWGRRGLRFKSEQPDHEMHVSGDCGPRCFASGFRRNRRASWHFRKPGRRRRSQDPATWRLGNSDRCLNGRPQCSAQQARSWFKPPLPCSTSPTGRFVGADDPTEFSGPNRSCGMHLTPHAKRAIQAKSPITPLSGNPPSPGSL